MKLSQAHTNATKRVVIHGVSGSGKSTLAANLAKAGFHLIWLNIENAAETLLKLPPEAQDNIELLNLPDTFTFPIAAQTLLTLFQKGEAKICDAHGKHACSICAKSGGAITHVNFNTLTPRDIVVLDTATQLAFSIMAYNMKDKAIEVKPEREDWGALRKFTEFFKSQFQGATYNLVVICQSTEAELEDGVSKLVPAFGSAAMSAAFGAAFDHVIYCEIKNSKHRAYSRSTASVKFLTRSRSDFAIETLAEPSLAPIFGNPNIEYPTQRETRTESTVLSEKIPESMEQTQAKPIVDLQAKLAELRNARKE